MRAIVTALLLLLPTHAFSASGEISFDYEISDSCEIRRSNFEGKSEPPPIEYEAVIYKFVDTLRKPMYERRITLHREDRRPIDLICRVDMTNTVHEAWLERPTRLERKREPERIKTRNLKLEDGKLPMLGNFRYETTWFSPCGLDVQVKVDDVSRPEFDLGVPIEEVAFEISEITIDEQPH